MQSFLHSIGELLTPVLRESNFAATGRLTPDEFVQAGDFLTFKCPTWQWAPAEAVEVRRDFLPADRQYLLTRGVPSVKRINEDLIREQDVTPGTSVELLEEAVVEGAIFDLRKRSATSESDNLEDIPDLETFVPTPENLVIADPDAVVQLDSSQMIVKTRTYDLFITYDKYYQTPRMWLTGYDEHGLPLNAGTIFEDISREHAKKTVTLESFPHHAGSGTQWPTVHPCKHADVMQSILANSRAGSVRVDQYLIVFLKWMATVLPTINYDFTMSS